MSINNVKKYLEKFNLDQKIIVLNESSATVALAAEALGCKECEIGKSLSFLVDGKPIIIVCSGEAKIDNQKYKGEFNTKASMIKYDEVKKYIGHEPGGVCPFAVNEDVVVYLDVSLKKLDIVYPACGSANSAIPLTLNELEQSSNYVKWIDVCKDEI